MPDINEEITLKIVGSPYKERDSFFVDVKMWGNPQGWIFKMKIGKTLFNSLYDDLLLEEELSSFMSNDTDRKSSIDKALKVLDGKIITVRGLLNEGASFKDKDGNIRRGKIFKVKIRGDLQRVEKEGGEIYRNALYDVVLNNIFCKRCVLDNTAMAKYYDKKKKEFQDRKEAKIKEIVKKKEEADRRKGHKLDDYWK